MRNRLDRRVVDPLGGRVERRCEEKGSSATDGDSAGHDGTSDEAGRQQVQGHYG